MNRAAVPLTILLLMGFIAGCGSKDKDGKGQDGRAGDSSSSAVFSENAPLTDDFFPLKASEQRKCVFRNYKVAKKDLVVSFKEENGTATWSTAPEKEVRYWKLGANAFELKLQYASTHSEFYRLHNGNIEYLEGIDAWRPQFKLNVKPGDKWLHNMLPIRNREFDSKYFKCIQNDGKPCAVITEVEYRANGYLTRRNIWLMKGVGIVMRNNYVTNPDVKEFQGKWLPVVQTIYSEWKGDTTPLVVEDIKKAKTSK